jgi:hypothetical protein
MSAIADFRLLDTVKLNELRDNAEIKVEQKLFEKKTIDHYWNYLNSNSKQLKDFEYSGYIFADLLVFLEENKGIDLLNGRYKDIADHISERRSNFTTILTYDHREAFLNKLNPDDFTIDELIAFNKDFSEQDDPVLAEAELAGIKALKDSLDQLSSDNQIVLLTVG